MKDVIEVIEYPTKPLPAPSSILWTEALAFLPFLD